MRRIRNSAAAIILALSSMTFSGCPLSDLIDDCFGEDTISAAEYDDLGVLQQLLYEENDCGRYEPVSSFLNDLL